MRAWETDAGALAVHDVLDFITMKIPPRDLLLAPWLESASLAMVYAAPGVGKTHFAMYLAHALTTGGTFLKWHAPQPVPVLYLDGEMSAPSMQSRWQALFGAEGREPERGMLRLVSRDLQEYGELPNLATAEGQAEIASRFGDARVVILDNLSSLMYGVKENEAEGWEPVAQWAIKQRAKGKTLVFIHHAGKSGGQRGSSKRMDLLDVCIRLERPSDHRPEEGARFTVRFEKARALCGAAVAPFEVTLAADGDDAGRWAMTTAEDADAPLLALHAQGLSLDAIGKQLGVDKSTVSRRLRRLKAVA